jgi:hypothetical protein
MENFDINKIGLVEITNEETFEINGGWVLEVLAGTAFAFQLFKWGWDAGVDYAKTH